MKDNVRSIVAQPLRRVSFLDRIFQHLVRHGEHIPSVSTTFPQRSQTNIPKPFPPIRQSKNSALQFQIGYHSENSIASSLWTFSLAVERIETGVPWKIASRIERQELIPELIRTAILEIQSRLHYRKMLG